MPFNETDIVADPVAHISISGVHGGDELDERLAAAELELYEEGDRGGFGRVVAGALVGAAIMYLLDPDRGARRRSLLRDKVVRAGNVSSDRLGKLGRDLRNRATGVAAETRSRFRSGDVDDAVLIERVRSEIGHRASHPGSIVVTAMDGEISLSGPVLADEKDKLIATAKGVRGVKHVHDRLTCHDTADGIPGLQSATT